MATKVKPSRLQVSWTPQAWCVPVYVNDDCFCWWAGWGWGWGCSQRWCITWTLCDQTDLQWALDCKQDKACMVCNLTSPDNSHYPTAKAVADAMACAWVWDMLKSVYDPNNIEANVYDYCNFVNTPTIPTDNCQLANWCGYTTCTGTLVASDIQCLARCCDIPTDNCQLANGCGYTTCTGTISDCAWIVSALGYTPYSNANPCGYTTCTGTLVAGDISWLVAESCIACINWCCLTQWGDICIQWGGGGIQLAPNSEYDVAYHWYWPQSCYDCLAQYYTCCANDTAYFTTDE